MLEESVVLLMAVLFIAAETQEFFNRSDCPPANEGDTANIAFYSSRQEDISSQDLLFFLRRDEGPDILSCIQAARASEAECDESDSGVTTKGLKGGKLTLVISNVTKNMLGSYALHVLSSEKSYYPSVCKLTILEKDGGRTDKEEAGQDAFLIVGVVAGLVAFIGIIVCLTCFVLRRKRKRREQRYCGTQHVEWLDSTELTVFTLNGEHCTSPQEERERASLLPSPDTDQSSRVVHETHNEKITVSDSNTGYIDWELSKSEERELLIRYGPGSFFIRRNKNDPVYDVLTVNCDNRFEYFMIKKEGSNVEFRPEETSFKSLLDLVEHYKHNEIRTTEGKVYCKLTYPCTRNNPTHEENQTVKPHSSSTDPAKEMPNDTRASETVLNPESEKFKDEMVLRMDERGELLHRGPGAFLVRESKTDPEVYMLAVNYENKAEYFTITKCGHLFVFEAADTSFNSLPELVQHYKEHEIRTVRGGVYCKLSEPCSDDQKEENSQQHEHHQTGKPPLQSAYPEQQEVPFTSTQGANSEKNSEKHENHQTGKPPSPSAYPEQQEEPFTSTQGADSEKLVGEKMQRLEENKLLRSCGQGSFRITRNKRVPANYTLAVFWNSKVIYFEIAPHNFKFRFVETGKDFESLSDLVAHYTQHDIRVSNGTLYCKLTTPCTSGPDSD